MVGKEGYVSVVGESGACSMVGKEGHFSFSSFFHSSFSPHKPQFISFISFLSSSIRFLREMLDMNKHMSQRTTKPTVRL